MRYRSVLKGAFVYAVFFLCSCIHLKSLNEYSSGAVKNLREFEELGYSFTTACNEKCTFEQLEKQLLKNNCDCNDEKEADRNTLLLYHAVKGYFEGLVKLSDNELTTYKFSGLTRALKEGDFGGLTINKSHLDAYAKISGILTRSITDAWRKNKLSKYVEDANDAIKILLEALEFNLVANLSKKLNIKNQRLESYYSDLLHHPSVSLYEKKKIIEEYNKELMESESRKKLIASFAEGLHSIAEGHQKIYDKRNRLNGKEVMEMLAQYSSDLQDVVDEFNTIKNK